MATRYAITCINKDGLRGLIHAAQGRFMKERREDAEQDLKDLLSSNSASRLISVYGKQGLATLRVDPFDCYDHGDPKGVYVDQPLYLVAPGRCILRDGDPFITIHRCTETSPVDADEITHTIARLLNEAQ